MENVRCGRSGLCPTSRKRGASAKDFFDLARNRIDLGHPVDVAQNATLPIIREYRRCLAMIDFESRLDCLRPVVRTADEFARATSVANPVDLGSIVAVVIASATMLTSKASGEPLDQGALIDLELDHMVEPETAPSTPITTDDANS